MRESPIYQEILEEGVQVGMERGKQEGIQVGVERGKQEGIQVGMERGKREEKEQIARNLLQLGISIEQVAIATELSIEQIKSLGQK